MVDEVQPSLTQPDQDRLSGWKEIAAFLDKGVRTVQRWERLYGLPVKRLGKEGGEIIFASRREIATWLDSEGSRRAARENTVKEAAAATVPVAATDVSLLVDAEPPPTATAIRNAKSRGAAVVAVLSVFAALVGWKVFGGTTPGSRLGIRSIEAVLNDVVAYDAERRELWRYQTGIDLLGINGAWVPQQIHADYAVLDVDDDGRDEVLVAVGSTTNQPSSAFLLLNENGTLRAKVRSATKVRIAGQVSGDPWIPDRLFLVADDGRERLFVAFIATHDFASLLVEIDARGEILSEYLSNGYVNSVVSLPWNGKRVLAVGAANNEHHGGSLAIFRNGRATGAAPAQKPDYLCTECPSGGPDDFLVFPARCFNKRWERSSVVANIKLHGPDRIVLEVLEGEDKFYSSVAYVLGAGLEPIRAESTSGLREVHAKWFAEGRVDHPLSEPRDGPDFLRVLRWAGGKFEALPAAPVVW